MLINYNLRSVNNIANNMYLFASQLHVDFFSRKGSNRKNVLKIEIKWWNFDLGKFINYTLKTVHNKGADKTARKHRLVCAFDVRKRTTCMSRFLSNKPLVRDSISEVSAIFDFRNSISIFGLLQFFML